MAWENVSFSDAVDLKKYPKKPLTGFYMGYREIDTKFGTKKLHKFMVQKDGKQEEKEVWGFTSLDSLLETIDRGVLVRVTYTGMVKKETKYGMKDVHICEVQQDPSQRIPVHQQPAPATHEDFTTPVGSDVADDEDLPF